MARTPTTQTGIVIKDEAILVTQVLISDKRILIRYHRRFNINPELSVFDNLKQVLPNIPRALLKKNQTTFVIPPDQITIQHFKLPDLNPRDFKIAIENQIEDKDKVYWSHTLLTKPKNQADDAKNILIIKVAKEVVEHYINIFDKFQIPLAAIITSSNLIEAEIALMSHKDTSRHSLVIDLDNKFLKIYLLENSKLLFFRYVPYGSEKLLQSLSRKVKLKNEQEQEISIEQAKEVLAKYDLFKREDDTDLPLEHLFFLIRPNLEKFTFEINKSITFFSEQINEEVAHDTIVLTGNFLKIKNVITYLVEALKTNVIDPQLQEDVVTIPKNLTEKHNILAISIAAALFIKSTGTAFNLLPLHYRNRQLKRLATILVIMGILLSLSFNSFFMSIAIKNNLNLTKKIKETTYNINQVNLKRKLVINKKNLSEKDMEALTFINNIEKTKIPVNEFLYQLSKNTIQGMKLEKIIIDEKYIQIYGSIIQSQSQVKLISYINKLELIPYLDEVQFEFGNTEGFLTDFIINANIKTKEPSK